MRMAVGSVVVVVKGVSRHISWRVLMRPPVICFVWTKLGSVVGHSVGKKEETRRRASVGLRRIGLVVALVAMFVDVIFCSLLHEKDRF
jgi:hypothetical protein